MRIYLVVADSFFTPRVVSQVAAAMTQRKWWCRYQEHAWLIGTEESAAEVSEALGYFVKDAKGAAALVVEVTPDAQVAGWQNKDVWDWLAIHRPQVARVT